MEDILEIKNLCKQYPGFRLEDVSFALPKGAIMGFVGENGAGKTTTIKLILNLIERDSGQIKLFGQDNIKDERAIKEQVGVVFDEGYFYEGLKPKEIGNVMKGIFKSWDSALFHGYLDRFGLPANKTIKDYSKGDVYKRQLQRKRSAAHPHKSAFRRAWRCKSARISMVDWYMGTAESLCINLSGG